MNTVSAPKIGRLIGILTLCLLIPSLFVLSQLVFAGAWYATEPPAQVFHIFAYVYYYAIVIPFVALIIGLSIIKQKYQVLKANVAFQIISIVIIVFDTILIAITFPSFNVFSAEYAKLATLALSAAILYLIFSKPLKFAQVPR